MKILVVTGASGGHIFPALAFLRTLKDSRDDMRTHLILPRPSLQKWASSEENVRNQLKTLGCKVSYVSISSINLSLGLKNFIAMFRFFKGTLESVFILLEFQPDIVVGFGSIICVPMVVFAWLFRIKTLIHEQNLIPGRANRFLAGFADKIAVSFDESREYLRRHQRKVVFTGNPLRKELRRCNKNEALRFFGLSEDRFTILVMGGSIGSHKINAGFPNAVSALPDKSGIQIIHLSGVSDYELLMQRYKDLNINVRLFSFLKEMQYAYSACDLVVSRAGATSIAEIIFFMVPAIIVPYPFAYAHQLGNAGFLARRGCAVLIKDEDLNAHILREVLEEIANNPEKIKKMRTSYNSIAPINANDLFVNEVMSLN